jgi:hypothetical protein
MKTTPQTSGKVGRSSLPSLLQLAPLPACRSAGAGAVVPAEPKLSLRSSRSLCEKKQGLTHHELRITQPNPPQFFTLFYASSFSCSLGSATASESRFIGVSVASVGVSPRLSGNGTESLFSETYGKPRKGTERYGKVRKPKMPFKEIRAIRVALQTETPPKRYALLRCFTLYALLRLKFFTLFSGMLRLFDSGRSPAVSPSELLKQSEAR